MALFQKMHDFWAPDSIKNFQMKPWGFDVGLLG
jgi:hypothetical protein